MITFNYYVMCYVRVRRLTDKHISMNACNARHFFLSEIDIYVEIEEQKIFDVGSKIRTDILSIKKREDYPFGYPTPNNLD